MIIMHFFLKIHKLNRKPEGIYLSALKKRVCVRERKRGELHMDFFFTHPCAFLSTGSLESLESLRTLKRERERLIHRSIKARRERGIK